jgi:DNA-binding response OmpR family regulator
MSNTKPLILVVEDEKNLAEILAAELDRAGMDAQVCPRAEAANRFLERNSANLMLLDLNLPDSSGLTFLQQLRQRSASLPTIILTGNSNETDKIQALNLGADDYVTKPFSSAELVARINAVLRRSETTPDQYTSKHPQITREPFQFCGAVVNPNRVEIEFGNSQVEKIGRKELGILSYLAKNPGVVISRRSLIHAVWGIHADVRSRSLDQYVVRIRNTFADHGWNIDAFRTVHGMGYIYDPEGQSPMSAMDASNEEASILENRFVPAV